MSNRFSSKALIYIIILAIIAAAIIIYTVHIMDWSKTNWLPVLLLLGLTILSDSFPVNLPKGGKLSVSYATISASIILFQPLIVIIIGSIFDFISLVKKEDRIKKIFNTSQLAICSGSASLVYSNLVLTSDTITTTHLISFLAAVTVLFALNSLFVTLVISITTNEKISTVWQLNIKWSILTNLATAFIGGAIAIVYNNIGLWGIALFLIPLFIARQANQSYINMRQTYLDTMASLSMVIDAKDPYTMGHSSRVANYATLLARELKWKENKVEFIHYIAMIHDIGKIAVPENILNKKTLLTPEEYEIIKTHSRIGANLVKDVKFFSESSEIIMHHHERYDGNGYPDQLKGDEIPCGARLLFVADAFDAMTSDRPYRKAMGIDQAIEELKINAGTQFDPKMVDAFIKAITRTETEINNT